MSRWQKICYFDLVVTVAGFVIAAIVIANIPKAPFMPPNLASVVLVVTFALVGASSKFIFRKQTDQLDSDERDTQIHRTARLAGYVGFTACMFLGIMIAYFIVGPKGSVPGVLLPVIPTVGVGVYIVVGCVAALSQYGWRDKGGHA